MKARFLREERGFTLTEMMITLVIWIVVLFALYNIFDATTTAFVFGNNEVEAGENARVGLDKMEREIRQAYAFNRGATPTPDTRLFDTWNATQIRFGNDLDGDGKSGPTAGECPNINQCELISYSVDADTGTLMRTSGGFPPQPMVENVDYVDAANTGLAFTYCQRIDGPDTVTDDNCPIGFDVATSEPDISLVRIQLRVRVNGGHFNDGTQTLSTDVALRNRDGL